MSPTPAVSEKPRDRARTDPQTRASLRMGPLGGCRNCHLAQSPVRPCRAPGHGALRHPHGHLARTSQTLDKTACLDFAGHPSFQRLCFLHVPLASASPFVTAVHSSLVCICSP